MDNSGSPYTRSPRNSDSRRAVPRGNNSLTAKDWLQLGLDVLSQEGINSVKVLPLAKKMGVTRGSFYWHFENREDLLTQILEYWEEFLTDAVIDQARQLEGSPQTRLRDVLTNVMLNRQDRYDSAIIAWSQFDQKALDAYNRVKRKRLRFLKKLLVETGLQKSDADFRARLLLSFVLMSHDALPTMSKAQVKREIEQALDLIMRK